MDAKEISRDTKWGSYDGRVKRIKDLEDTHVLNLVGYTRKRIKKLEVIIQEKMDNELFESANYLKETLEIQKKLEEVFREEVKLRKLEITPAAEEGIIPFRDKDGNLMRWSYENNSPYKIPNSVRFIKKVSDSSSSESN